MLTDFIDFIDLSQYDLPADMLTLLGSDALMSVDSGMVATRNGPPPFLLLPHRMVFAHTFRR
ncbi:hypothetical protein BH708_14245 [Brachybacterium sp. P6-10-X1]|nr:hypothetical protein BH708_14245 [Brachybacterium sp. P6-10-X1]